MSTQKQPPSSPHDTTDLPAEYGDDYEPRRPGTAEDQADWQRDRDFEELDLSVKWIIP